MTRRFVLRSLCALALLPLATPFVRAADPAPKAVFAVSDADPKKWQMVLNNLKNARAELPEATLELVVFGPAIDMVRATGDAAAGVKEALAAGVRVQACRNSLKGMHIDEAELVPGTTVVPSGVAHLIRRQGEGYAYVRP